MIHEVDEGLRRLLSADGVLAGGVELVFDAPTRDWAARRNGPAVNVFLHDIREDVTRRQAGAAPEHDGDGTVAGWREPPRWFRLAYLVTAWTTRPQDEHRLLSQVLACLIRANTLAGEQLTGSLAELGLAVRVEAASPTDGPAATDLWSALGGELKPGIDLLVVAPLAGGYAPAGPPVTEGLVVRPEVVGEGERRLRYEGASDPGPAGFAPYRPRQLPPGRRRRGAGR